jgi:hypothetical protein
VGEFIIMMICQINTCAGSSIFGKLFTHTHTHTHTHGSLIFLFTFIASIIFSRVCGVIMAAKYQDNGEKNKESIQKTKPGLLF